MYPKHSFKNILILSAFTCLIVVPLLQAEMLEFSLYDSYGRKVSSQDYKGVPLFLEFGACW